MALFASLSERLNHIFSKLTKRGKLTELEIRTAMREVRVALLEADVNLKVYRGGFGESGGAGNTVLAQSRAAGHQDRE